MINLKLLSLLFLVFFFGCKKDDTNPLTPSPIPSQGLVAYYPFNGNANDASGNGKDGITIGTVLTADRFGNANSAYSFDGINDWINCVFASTDSYTNLTVNIWFKTNDFHPLGSDQALNGNLISRSDSANSGTLVRIVGCGSPSPFTGKLEFEIEDGHSVETSDLLDDNIWHMATIVLDANNLAMYGYVDGILINNTAYDGNIGHLAKNWNIGTRLNGELTYNNTKEFFHGILDDVRIYNRALSAEEIISLFNE